MHAEAKPAPLRHLPAVLLVLIPLCLVLPALFGSSVLVGVHTSQLEPWRSATEPTLLSRIEEQSLPLAADKTLMFHPQLVVALARVRGGEAPLWNPGNLCGVPLLAQAVHGVLYPLNWLGFALGPLRAYAWIWWLQTALAGLLMFALARELGVGPWPACLAGLAFAFCGYFALRPNWFQITGASIWLPGALLGTLRLLRGPAAGSAAPTASIGHVTLAALCIGCSLLAGFPQGSLYIIYACVLLTVAGTLPALLRGGPPRRAALAAGLRVAAALTLGVALGLPQLLPAAELAQSEASTRRAVTPELAATLGLRPASLGAALLPDLFGHPRDLAQHESTLLRSEGLLSRLFCKPGTNAVETASSISLVALLLALLGAAAPGRGRALGLTLMLCGALFAVDTPLLAPVLHLPGLATGDPRRVLLLFCAGGALLAARGLQHLLERGPPRWFTWSAGALASATLLAAAIALAQDGPAWTARVVPALAEQLVVPAAEVAPHAADLSLDLHLLQRALLRGALFALLGFVAVLLCRNRRAWGAALLLLAACADLLSVALRAQTLLPEAGYDRPPPGIEALLDDDGGRLVRFHPGGPDALGTPLPPDTSLPFGVRDLSGYITLAPRRVEALHELLQPGTTFGIGTAALSDVAALSSPLLDALAVTRVLSSVPLQVEGLLPLGRVGAAWLYRNEGALPRAYLTPAVRSVPDEAAARIALAAPDFDAHLFTVIEATATSAESARRGSGAGPEAGPRSTVGSGPRAIGTARMLRDNPEHIAVAVSLAAPGLLVLCDSWMPGWSATVDGAPAALLHANLAFRGVELPAGDHTVAFDYRSRAWELAWPTGTAALAGLLLCGVTAMRRRRPAPEAPAPSPPPASPPRDSAFRAG